MKTLEELYSEILANDGLKEQLKQAVKAGKLEEFAKANGCDATVEDIRAFVASKKKEVAVDELDNVAGGSCGVENFFIDVTISFVTLTIACDMY